MIFELAAGKKPKLTFQSPSLSPPPSLPLSLASRFPPTSFLPEFIHLISSEANDACEKDQKKTIAPEHVVSALKALGFDTYIEEVEGVLDEHKEHVKVSSLLKISRYSDLARAYRTPTRSHESLDLSPERSIPLRRSLQEGTSKLTSIFSFLSLSSLSLLVSPSTLPPPLLHSNLSCRTGPNIQTIHRLQQEQRHVERRTPRPTGTPLRQIESQVRRDRRSSASSSSSRGSRAVDYAQLLGGAVWWS